MMRKSLLWKKNISPINNKIKKLCDYYHHHKDEAIFFLSFNKFIDRLDASMSFKHCVTVSSWIRLGCVSINH